MGPRKATNRMTDERPILGQFHRGGFLDDIRVMTDVPPVWYKPRPIKPTIWPEDGPVTVSSLDVDEYRRTGRAEGRITVLEWMRLLPDAPLPPYDHSTHEIDVRWVRYDLHDVRPPQAPRLTPEDIDKLGEVLPNGRPAYDLQNGRVVPTEEQRLIEEIAGAMTEYDDDNDY